MQLITSFKQAEQNAIRFSKVFKNEDSTAFSRLGKFFHWYYFPDLDVIAPSKFIGYKDTTLRNYGRDGSGSDTTKVLDSWFQKLDKESASFKTLEKKLSMLLDQVGVKLSIRMHGGTGGIYVPKLGNLPITSTIEICILNTRKHFLALRIGIFLRQIFHKKSV